MKPRIAACLVLSFGCLAPRGLAAAGACVPAAVEKAGQRFDRVCPEGFWISATPLACAEGESAACDPITALESSSLLGKGKNRHVDALVVGADVAERLCRERFGGRLPSMAERAAAERALGLATLQVREEPGEYARLRLDALPEWVSGSAGPARYPDPPPPPRRAAEVLLGCVAEPAMPRARWVPLGSVCDERPPEAGVRSPDCAIGLAGGGLRFELGCDPAHPVRSRAKPEDAALRCVLPPR